MTIEVLHNEKISFHCYKENKRRIQDRHESTYKCIDLANQQQYIRKIMKSNIQIFSYLSTPYNPPNKSHLSPFTYHDKVVKNKLCFLSVFAKQIISPNEHLARTKKSHFRSITQ